MPEPQPPKSAAPTPPEHGDTHDVHDLHAPIIREQTEPRDGFEPVPPGLTIVFGLLLFWGGYYMSRYSADFRSDVYNESFMHHPPSAAALDKPKDPVQEGKRLYTTNCSACHQASGTGEAGKFPPLAGSEWVVGPPHVLAAIPLHGLQGAVTVKGETYSGNMPVFGDRLKDEQLAFILTFIRQEWGNKAGAISPELVAAVRKETGQRGPWSAAELEALKNQPPPKVEAAAPAQAAPGQAAPGAAAPEKEGAPQETPAEPAQP